MIVLDHCAFFHNQVQFVPTCNGRPHRIRLIILQNTAIPQNQGRRFIGTNQFIACNATLRKCIRIAIDHNMFKC